MLLTSPAALHPSGRTHGADLGSSDYNRGVQTAVIRGWPLDLMARATLGFQIRLGLLEGSGAEERLITCKTSFVRFDLAPFALVPCSWSCNCFCEAGGSPIFLTGYSAGSVLF